MVCFFCLSKVLYCFSIVLKDLPVKYLYCDISATWHIPGKYECIGAHTMRYCTVQLCLHTRNSTILMVTYEMQAHQILRPCITQTNAHLIFQPFWCTLVILIEVGKSKDCLICPINSGVHAVIVMRAMATAVHIHPSLQTDLCMYIGKLCRLACGTY